MPCAVRKDSWRPPYFSVAQYRVFLAARLLAVGEALISTGQEIYSDFLILENL
jgi:hypothetical protein